MKRILITTFLCLFAITSCDLLKPKPKRNPHPKYFVTISGHVNPTRFHHVYYAAWAVYGGYNPKCEETLNYLEDIKGFPAHTDYYPLKTNTAGNFTLKIPIDAYQPGHCHWKIAFIRYDYSFKPLKKDAYKRRFADMFHFGTITNPNESPAMPLRINSAILCKKNMSSADDCDGYYLFANYVKSVPRNRSYHYHLTISA